jgi:ferredoxin
MAEDYMTIPRQTIPTIALERRTGITEVELVFDEATARREAQRCLHCWINTIFEGSEAKGSECILCGGCVDVCPENCIELLAIDRIDFDAPAPDAPAQGSVMLKDETRCIRCGLCAERCPVGTITMEAWSTQCLPM